MGVLAAVQETGHALRYSSEDIQANESVVLAAVQQNGHAIRYASEDVRRKIEQGASQFGIHASEYAGAMLHPQLVQLQVLTKSATQDLMVTCHNLAGEMLATVTLQQKDNKARLHQKIAEALRPPHGPASLIVCLSEGLEADT